MATHALGNHRYEHIKSHGIHRAFGPERRAMSDPLVFGLDPGNSEASGVMALAGKTRTLSIPSDIGAGNLTQLTRIRGGAAQFGRLALDEHVLEVDGSSWFVGTLALDQSATASSARGDIGRYWSGHTLRLLMVLAGTLITERSFTLRVVTGLPVTVWDTATTVPQVLRSLCGTHAFRLNGQARVMTVTGVMVVMEGAGALAVHGLAEDVPQGVIDIGGRTTELFWAHGQRPVLPRCTGFDRGVGNVGDTLAAAFLEQHGRALTSREIRACLRAYAQGQPQPPIFVEGRPVQLHEAIARAVHDVAADIRSQVSRAWRSSEQGKVAAEAARVLLIGGGAYYFAPLLRALIPHLEVPKQAEHANAQGYLAIGSQLPERAWARLRG
jgi:hypothetical protein